MKVVLDTFKKARSKSNIWIIPVFEGQLPKAARKYGFELQQARVWGFRGKHGTALSVKLNDDNQHAMLIGAGKKTEFNAEKARQTIGRAVRNDTLRKADASNVLFLASEIVNGKLNQEVVIEALAEGAALGAYEFTRLKAKGSRDDGVPGFPKRLLIAVERVRQKDRQRLKEGLVMAKWTNWGRDLLNQPQSHMTASKLANTVRTAARDMRKVRCTIWGQKEIERAKMRLLLAVNMGSAEPPRFITLQYNGGAAKDPPICFVGKGLTYDTGGYNIKPGDSMRGMHMDKGGAIGALSSFFAVADMGVRKNVVCLVPSTDNRISATAMVPGDVFVGLSGTSVEVDNTDAEGRLVLADALAYAKKYAPSHIIDLATLTGAAVVALGDQASALFCDDDSLAKELLRHGEAAGELLWRMPLWDVYNSKLKSKVADVKNVGDRWGGAITAALFLRRFVPDGVKWCHLDIAGKMAADGSQAYTPDGSGYGFGPRLLARWLRGRE